MNGACAAIARRPTVPDQNNKFDPASKLDFTSQSKDVPLLLTVSSFVLSLPTAPSAAAGEGETTAGSANLESSTQTLQRERRIYRGAVYEKGEDHQWHLLHD
jgi:hypothetical protein